MTPEQRARALRLADGLSSPMGEPGVTGWATMMDAANLLRELAAEPERVPLTDDEFEEFIEQFRWYEGDVDRYDIQGFARELLRAHGITGDAK